MKVWIRTIYKVNSLGLINWQTPEEMQALRRGLNDFGFYVITSVGGDALEVYAFRKDSLLKRFWLEMTLVILSVAMLIREMIVQ